MGIRYDVAGVVGQPQKKGLRGEVLVGICEL